jgi:hypothetical protein
MIFFIILKKLMKKHWWLLSLTAVFFFFFGVLFDKWVKNWAFLTLKAEIDIFSAITSLISIFLTLAVAFWVTMVLEKRTNDQRTQKDIIIRHTGLLFSILEDLRTKVRLGSIEYLLAASWIKRLNVNTSFIVVELVKASIDDGTAHEILIQDELSVLKVMMTNSVANDPDLRIVNGIISISEPRRILIEGQLDKVLNEFFKFELTINKS